MKVKVKYLDKKTDSFDIIDNKVLSLKKEILKKNNIYDKSVKLVYRGKILNNEDSLIKFEIEEDSCVYCYLVKSKNIIEIKPIVENKVPTIGNNRINNIIDLLNNVPEIPNLTPSYINLKDKYKNEIEEIKNMGFDDEDEILKALFVSKGSVTIAINKLINKN